MSTTPLVSVLSPIYNGEKHVEECIKGVLNQTYELFEYVIVDNASTDGTPEIIEKFRKNDKRIRVFRNKKTLCMEDNFNKCANYASPCSKWLKFALADDYLFPNCIKKMVDVGESDETIGIVSAYRLAGTVITNTGLPLEKNIFNGSEILKKQILRKLHVISSSPNSVMYRKKAFLELDGYNPRYDHSDTEFALRLLEKYNVGFVHEVLTKSGRESGGGELKSIMNGQKIIEYLDFGYKSIKKYKNLTLTSDEMDGLRIYYGSEILNFIIAKLAAFKPGLIKKMVKNTPPDIKIELKKIFFKNWYFYTRRFCKFLLKS